MQSGAIAVFRKVRGLLSGVDGFTSSDNAMRWSELAGEFVSCTTMDPAATKFSLFGAVWRSLPAQTEDGKKMQLAAFTKLASSALRHKGLDPGPSRDAAGGAYNTLDAWQLRLKTQKATVAMLDLMIEALTEMASGEGSTQ